uniref:Uncharacterized protein n=1 Tax=Denticeps clupeoides TaxID=299321 RepID=A0AAY4C848_9TELE
MNGTLYISFFQGQLESALEQVVQLAVQEITKTVGASLNALLLETAARDQENQRLRLRLQAKGGAKCDAARAEGAERGVRQGAPRLEQKGRAVVQLKVVMEQVLEFALCELTKIVEDSFDDLFLELTKKDSETDALRDRLRAWGKDVREERKGSITAAAVEERDNDSDSPGSSERARQELFGGRNLKQEVLEKKEQATSRETMNEPDKQKVLNVTQDWVPIMDKVFGQKWCSDLWKIKELKAVKAEDNTDLATGPTPNMEALIRETLDPPPPGAKTDKEKLQWLETEPMKVVIPPSNSQGEPVVCNTGDESQMKSPSMLHRLLTLPSQLLEGEEESMEGIPSLSEAPCDADIPLALDKKTSPASPTSAKGNDKADDDDEEEEEDEEEKSDDSDCSFSPKAKSKKQHVCKQCDDKMKNAFQDPHLQDKETKKSIRIDNSTRPLCKDILHSFCVCVYIYI